MTGAASLGSIRLSRARIARASSDGAPRSIAFSSRRRAAATSPRLNAATPLSSSSSDSRCRWLLVNPEAIGGLHDIIDLHQWRLIRTLRRPTARSDDLLLYQRLTP